MVIIIIEFIFIVSAWLMIKRRIDIQTNCWGKIKMILQVTGVVVLLLAIIFDWAALLPFASGIFYLAIAFAIISLFTYGI